jgi:chitinase
VPGRLLTHINYAFINVDPVELTCILGDMDQDPIRIPELNGPFREQNPRVKSLMSIGGWTWSADFSDAALTPESREKFVDSCMALMEEWDFDGIDIDWEFPVDGGCVDNTRRDEDAYNYNLLLQRFRSKMSEPKRRSCRAVSKTADDAWCNLNCNHNPSFCPEATCFCSGELLTIAHTSSPRLVDLIEFDGMHQALDFVNIMTYDLQGGWSPFTSHHTPLNPTAQDPEGGLDSKLNAAGATASYAQGGFPAEKIAIGAAFYGHAFSGVVPRENVPEEQEYLFADFVENGGAPRYSEIRARLDSGELIRYWDEGWQAPYAVRPENATSSQGWTSTQKDGWQPYAGPAAAARIGNASAVSTLNCAVVSEPSWECFEDTQLVYEVAGGDSCSALSTRFGRPMGDIFNTRTGQTCAESACLWVGDEVIVCGVAFSCTYPDGEHEVVSGDNCFDLGTQYQVGQNMLFNTRSQMTCEEDSNLWLGDVIEVCADERPPGGYMVGYDDPQSLNAKRDFCEEKGLQGVILWELSQDFDWELLEALNY